MGAGTESRTQILDHHITVLSSSSVTTTDRTISNLSRELVLVRQAEAPTATLSGQWRTQCSGVQLHLHQRGGSRRELVKRSSKLSQMMPSLRESTGREATRVIFFLITPQFLDFGQAVSPSRTLEARVVNRQGKTTRPNLVCSFPGLALASTQGSKRGGLLSRALIWLMLRRDGPLLSAEERRMERSKKSAIGELEKCPSREHRYGGKGLVVLPAAVPSTRMSLAAPDQDGDAHW
jgi:hypothetical protein